MADQGNVETMLAGIPSSLGDTRLDLRRILKQVFQYVLKDLRFGRAVAEEPSKNFGGGFFSGTTGAMSGDEFTIEHTFGRTPYLVIPVLPLDQVGAKIVPLEVSQAADSARIYLKSTVTDAPVFVYIEG